MSIVPFEGWRPDQPDLANPGDIDASGVIPDEMGYRPCKDLAAVVSSLDARARGATAVTDSDGNAIIYAADQTKLYQNSGSSFADVSVAAGYDRSEDSRVEFALYDQYVVSTDYDSPVQGKLFSASLFSDLITGTHKPKARTMGVVGNFLMLGNTNDATDGQKQSRVWWSAFDDVVDFDPDATTQCDFQDIPGGGWVQRIIGGEYALIFQERQIIRGQYVGPPLIFDLSAVVDRQRGTPVPGSVAALGRQVFFVSEEGFFMQDGVQSTPIGDGKTDREFWSQLDIANKANVSACIDPINKLYKCAFPGTGSADGIPNIVFCYHWPSGRYSYVPKELELIFNSLTLGYTLEQLDTVSASIEDLPFSLDSRSWTGGQATVGAFNTSHAACTFSGSNLAASVTSKEIASYGGARGRIRRVRPITDAAAATVAVGARFREADTASFGSAVAMSTNGLCGANAGGRYHSFKVAIAAAEVWSFLRGVDVNPVGR